MSIKWNKNLEIGLKDIDYQHQEMIESMNNFLISIQQGESETRIFDLMDFMENYIHDHFRTEEAYQIKYQYPEYEKHKSFHENFKSKVAKFKSDLKKAPASLALAIKIQREMIQWVIEHIRDEDKKLGIFLADKK